VAHSLSPPSGTPTIGNRRPTDIHQRRQAPMHAPALPPTAPRIGERERLGATMVLSLLLHGMLVLGVGFALEGAAPLVPTLDVIITETTSPLTPAQADFLAQASNQGGGEQERSTRPRDDQAGLALQAETG